MALFVRLLEESDKGGALERVIEGVGVTANGPQAFDVDPTSFEQVPGAPFAYWVSERVRQLFGSMSALETGTRSARVADSGVHPAHAGLREPRCTGAGEAEEGRAIHGRCHAI